MIATLTDGTITDVTTEFFADGWTRWVDQDRKRALQGYDVIDHVRMTNERRARVAAAAAWVAAAEVDAEGPEALRASDAYEAACLVEDSAMARAAGHAAVTSPVPEPVSEGVLDAAQAASAVAAALVADDHADQDAVAYLRQTDDMVARLTHPPPTPRRTSTAPVLPGTPLRSRNVKPWRRSSRHRMPDSRRRLSWTR